MAAPATCLELLCPPKPSGEVEVKSQITCCVDEHASTSSSSGSDCPQILLQQELRAIRLDLDRLLEEVAELRCRKSAAYESARLGESAAYDSAHAK